MGFRTGAYATIWQVKQGTGNYIDVRLSTSKKNKQTDQYETDFNGYVRFIGTAKQNAEKLKEKDRIRIGECETTNHYDKEKNVTYTNYAIFTFEQVDSISGNNGNGTGNNSAKPNDFVNVPDATIEEELPFN